MENSTRDRRALSPSQIMIIDLVVLWALGYKYDARKRTWSPRAIFVFMVTYALLLILNMVRNKCIFKWYAANILMVGVLTLVLAASVSISR